MTALQEAKRYSDAGLVVIPVLPRSKRPAEGWRDFQTRRPDPEEVKTWFADSEGNVGVVAGAVSGIVVVDVDGPEGERTLAEREVPRTVTTLTSKGRHLWFAHPGGVVKNRTRFLPGLDLRGDGGYVLVPPSVHPSGHVYTFAEGLSLGEVEIAPLPTWVMQATQRPLPRNDSEAGGSTSYGMAALKAETVAIQAASEGTRNDTLNTAAFLIGQLVGGGVLDRTRAEVQLVSAGLAAGLDSVETRRTVRSGLEAGICEPRTPANGKMTPSEQAALSRLREAFPGATVGEFAPFEEETPPTRPHAVDVARLGREASREPGKMVVNGLIYPQSIIGVTGEEGQGKTMFADQGCRQIARGEAVFGLHDLGELRPKAILFFDTEQEEEEIRRRAAEMDTRGLIVPDGKMFWTWAGGLNLATSEEDRRYVEGEIERVGADLPWIDAGSNAVLDPKDDIEVKGFFNYLSAITRRYGLLAIGITLHPRKRGAGDYSRRFDDLFGSREWKGRLTKALYMENDKIICWKDRGSHVRRAWPNRVKGCAVARLLRPGLTDDAAVPFVIEAGEPDEEIDAQALEAKAVSMVEAQPGHYSKTSLANALGGRKEDALQTVSRMIREGKLGPDEARAKLSVEGEFPRTEPIL